MYCLFKDKSHCHWTCCGSVVNWVSFSNISNYVLSCIPLLFKNMCTLVGLLNRKFSVDLNSKSVYWVNRFTSMNLFGKPLIKWLWEQETNISIFKNVKWHITENMSRCFTWKVLQCRTGARHKPTKQLLRALNNSRGPQIHFLLCVWGSGAKILLLMSHNGQHCLCFNYAFISPQNSA